MTRVVRDPPGLTPKEMRLALRLTRVLRRARATFDEKAAAAAGVAFAAVTIKIEEREKQKAAEKRVRQ